MNMDVAGTRRGARCRDCLLMLPEPHGKVYWYRCPLHGNRRVGHSSHACKDVVADFLADGAIESMLASAKARGVGDGVVSRAEGLVASHSRRDAWLLLNAALERSRTLPHVTTRRQSGRLVSAGMPSASAGMYYDGDSALPVPETGIPAGGVPCWTYRGMLSAMMSMPGCGGCSFRMDFSDNAYRAVCESPGGMKADGVSCISLVDAVCELLVFLLQNGKPK